MELQIINGREGSEETPDDKEIRTKHAQLFQSLQESQEYKEYIIKHKYDFSLLSQQIHQEAQKYLSSDINQIEADVNLLYTEIYGKSE